MLRLTVATVIKTVCHWQKDRHIDQWNQIENPERDLHKYAQLVFLCLFFFFFGGSAWLVGSSPARD